MFYWICILLTPASVKKQEGTGKGKKNLNQYELGWAVINPSGQLEGTVSDSGSNRAMHVRALFSDPLTSRNASHIIPCENRPAVKKEEGFLNQKKPFSIIVFENRTFVCER